MRDFRFRTSVAFAAFAVQFCLRVWVLSEPRSRMKFAPRQNLRLLRYRSLELTTFGELSRVVEGFGKKFSYPSVFVSFVIFQ